MNSLNKFHLTRTCPDSKARAGELITPHGVVPTPVFLPVGSQGTVKTLTPEEVKNVGVAMVLANTYHLYLRPGIPAIEKVGGLHKFMGWDDAILTDSGGYQIFSLARLRQVSDDGVVFRSHIDGSQHLLTPELIIQFQESLGADIIMVLDECSAHDDSFEKVQKAMMRTHNWAGGVKALKSVMIRLYMPSSRVGFSLSFGSSRLNFLPPWSLPGMPSVV